MELHVLNQNPPPGRPYAFDIHANSFFPFFLQLYVAQLLLAPVVTRSNWVCLWVGNTLYLSAVSAPLSCFPLSPFLAFNFPSRRVLSRPVDSWGWRRGNRQAQARSRLPRIASILVRVQRSLLLTLHSGRPVHAIRLRDLYVSFAFSSSSFPVLKGGRTEPPPKPPLLPSFANSEPPRARPADLGYNALPFLIRSELLLFPVAIFAAFYIVSLLGFNISHVVLEGLFGR